MSPTRGGLAPTAELVRSGGLRSGSPLSSERGRPRPLRRSGSKRRKKRLAAAPTRGGRSAACSSGQERLRVSRRRGAGWSPDSQGGATRLRWSVASPTVCSGSKQTRPYREPSSRRCPNRSDIASPPKLLATPPRPNRAQQLESCFSTPHSCCSVRGRRSDATAASRARASIVPTFFWLLARLVGKM